MPKVLDIPYNTCFHCLHTFPLTAICSFSLCIPSRSSFFSSCLTDWITFHFPDYALKKVKHSLPFSFLSDVKARSLAGVAEMDPGQRLLRTRKGKLSKMLFCSVHRLIWPCTSNSKLWDTWHALSVLFQVTSKRVVCFWQGYMCLKPLTVQQTLVHLRYFWLD